MMLLLLALLLLLLAARPPHKLNSFRLKRIVISVGFFVALYVYLAMHITTAVDKS